MNNKKVMLVTAASRGIGFSVVSQAADTGYEVYLAARDIKVAEEKVRDMRNMGLSVNVVYSDATDSESYESMFAEIMDRSGRLDVLVNNFGTSDPVSDRDIENTDVEVFLRTVNMNIKSVFLASQYAVECMKHSGGGSIVNISSVSGTVADISQISYGVAKAAINHMTKIIAVQEAQNNIRCNAVVPGMTATESVMNNLTDEFRDIFLKHTPLSRMAEAKEIADAVMYFAGDDSRFTTGQILSVSGGFGLGTPLYGDYRSAEQKR
ncbi:MAG: SDR family oxidoreductase [Eubacteriaceae bacterium]|nr:SDR family oxidoreductase [Eubacteriaceae bacterium]